MTRVHTLKILARWAAAFGSFATLTAGLTIAGCSSSNHAAQTQGVLDRVGSSLPPEWVADTRESLGDAEDRRVDAEAIRVRADADYVLELSDADLRRQGAQTRHDAALIEASRLHAESDANNQFNRTALEADGRMSELDQLTDADVLDALIERNSTELSSRRAQANRQWLEAQGAHEQMIAERISAEQRGAAAVNELEAQVEAAQIATANAAGDKLAEANAANISAQADADELQIRSESFASTSAARVEQSRAEARAVVADAETKWSRLTADAERLREVDATTNYDAAIRKIEADFNAGLSEARLAEADANLEMSALDAELLRRSAAIAHSLQQSRFEYESAIFAFERVVKEGLAKGDKNRSHADYIERVTGLRSSNSNRQRTTDQILAEVLDGRRTAELAYAETEAAAYIRAAGAKDLASLMKARHTDRPRTFERRGAHLWRGDADRVTTSTVNGVYPANLDPARLGPKTGLAYAEMLRALADADESELHARVSQLAADFASDHAETLAGYEDTYAGLNAFERSERARIEEQFAIADAQLIVVESARSRAIAGADGSRDEAIALADRLEAESSAAIGAAHGFAKRTLARADNVEFDAKRELERLDDERTRILVAGAARHAQFLAEADALETDRQARLAGVKGELDSKRAVLVTELAQLDAAASTFAAVSRAAFEESMSTADAFALAADAEENELSVVVRTGFMMAQAGFDERRTQLDNNETLTDTERRRMVAIAKRELEGAWTQSLVARAKAAETAQITRARADATELLANAEEFDAISTFEAQLARLRAAKNHAYANLIVAERSRDRATLDAAAAEQLHRALAERAFAELELIENQRLDASRPMLVKFRDGTLIVRPEHPNHGLDDAIDDTQLADVPEPIDNR